MTVDCSGSTATLLLSGEVLIAGGNINDNTLASTELYDPATNSFSSNTATMNVSRYLATATLLLSGKVLITGGSLQVTDPSTGLGYDMLLASTELYDPVSNSFADAADTATMNDARFADTATLLPSGQVLIAGGVDDVSFVSSTELYDPDSNSFAEAADTATMNVARYNATATLLSSGQVLIAGGYGGIGDGAYLSSTELYDPDSNSFAGAADTATMNAARKDATATLLPSGKVLIAGSYAGDGDILASTELYDPVSNSFAAVADTATMNAARYQATATLLPSGEVLISGGIGSDGSVLSSTELYDPASNSFAATTATMNVKRYAAPAILLAMPSGPTPTPTPSPNGSVTLLPSVLDFGTVTIGQSSAPSTITLSNGTAKKLTIRSSTIGRDFVVVGTTCSSTLNSDQSCTYMVSFEPRSAGTKNEVFKIADSATSQRVKLQGIGASR